jgi:hypothetical protein
MVNSLYENPDARRQVYTDYNQTEEVLRNELRPAQTAIEIPNSWDLQKDNYNPAGDAPHMVFTDVKGGYHRLANENVLTGTGTDFNKMTAPGFYSVVGNTNAPTTNGTQWKLLVVSNYGATGGVLQIASDCSTSNSGTYIRKYYGNWEAWKTIVTDNNNIMQYGVDGININVTPNTELYLNWKMSNQQFTALGDFGAIGGFEIHAFVFGYPSSIWYKFGAASTYKTVSFLDCGLGGYNSIPVPNNIWTSVGEGERSGTQIRLVGGDGVSMRLAPPQAATMAGIVIRKWGVFTQKNFTADTWTVTSTPTFGQYTVRKTSASHTH